jgi:hypothetical protein
MRSSFGFAAIAISTIHIVTVQTIAVANPPVSNLSQIATEISVRVVLPDPYNPEVYVGAIVKKDRDLYSILLSSQTSEYVKTYAEASKKPQYITTFDGQKYLIVAIENHDSGRRGSLNRSNDSTVSVVHLHKG